MEPPATAPPGGAAAMHKRELKRLKAEQNKILMKVNYAIQQKVWNNSRYAKMKIDPSVFRRTDKGLHHFLKINNKNILTCWIKGSEDGAPNISNAYPTLATTSQEDISGSTGYPQPISGTTGYTQPISDATRYPHPISDATGYPQSISGATGYPQPISGATGYPQPISDATGYPQSISGATGYPQPISDATGYPQPISGATGYTQPIPNAIGYNQPIADATGYPIAIFRAPAYPQTNPGAHGYPQDGVGFSGLDNVTGWVYSLAGGNGIPRQQAMEVDEHRDQPTPSQANDGGSQVSLPPLRHINNKTLHVTPNARQATDINGGDLHVSHSELNNNNKEEHSDEPILGQTTETNIKQESSNMDAEEELSLRIKEEPGVNDDFEMPIQITGVAVNVGKCEVKEEPVDDCSVKLEEEERQKKKEKIDLYLKDILSHHFSCTSIHKWQVMRYMLENHYKDKYQESSDRDNAYMAELNFRLFASHVYKKRDKIGDIYGTMDAYPDIDDFLKMLIHC